MSEVGADVTIACQRLPGEGAVDARARVRCAVAMSKEAARGVLPFAGARIDDLAKRSGIAHILMRSGARRSQALFAMEAGSATPRRRKPRGSSPCRRAATAGRSARSHARKRSETNRRARSSGAEASIQTSVWRDGSGDTVGHAIRDVGGKLAPAAFAAELTAPDVARRGCRSAATSRSATLPVHTALTAPIAA